MSLQSIFIQQQRRKRINVKERCFKSIQENSICTSVLFQILGRETVVTFALEYNSE